MNKRKAKKILKTMSYGYRDAYGYMIYQWWSPVYPRYMVNKVRRYFSIYIGETERKIWNNNPNQTMSY